ncbi:MAG: hypothetical protein ACLFP2_03765 [Candidatus Woesearchaeota archaeon]
MIFLFGALEEVSYGQNFFGFEFESQIHTENEFDFHNIDFYKVGCPDVIEYSIGCEGDDFIYFGVLLFGVSFILVILLSYNLYFGCIQEFFDFLIAFLFFRYSYDLNK